MKLTKLHACSGIAAVLLPLAFNSLTPAAHLAAGKDAKSPPIRELWKRENLTREQRDQLAKMVCLDNLKQLGFAAKRFGDTNGALPANWHALKSYLASPEFLVCVSDTNTTVVTNWSELKPANQTYELLSPNVAKPSLNVAVAKCPLHGHVVLATGQAFQGDYIKNNGLKIVGNKLQ